MKAPPDVARSQSSYHTHDLPTLTARDPLGADGFDGELSMMHTPGVAKLSLHPHDVDQTVRRIRALVKRATEMVCERLLRTNVIGCLVELLLLFLLRI